MKDSFKFRVGEVRISYRTEVAHPLDHVSSSREARDLLLPYFDDAMEHHEEFYALMLNRAAKPLAVYMLSSGGLAGTMADLRMLFQAALLSNAQSIIVAHNHPSGTLRPSDADRKLTKRMKDTGKILDIPVLDHLILTREGYYSFADEGEL